MQRILVAAILVGLAVLLLSRWTDAPASRTREADRFEEAAEPTEAPPPPTRVSELHRARFSGAVVDPEGHLEFFRHVLNRLAGHQRRDLGLDLQTVVFSAPDLPIASLAGELFELRHVGRHVPTGGILIVINPARSEARIQVSYSLEGALPDAFLGRLAADQLDPYVSYDAMGMGVMDTVELLERQIYLQAVRGRIELAEQYRAGRRYKARERFYSGGAGAQIELSDIPSDVDFKRRIEGPQRGRYAPSRDPLDSVEALQRSYRDFVGDPTLELFTPGTRYMYSVYPFAPFEKLERLYAREASRPLRAVVREDRAVVISDAPAPGFVPILLHRSDGLWRVDDVELWKNLTTTRSGGVVQRTANPYSFGLRAFGEGRHRSLGPWNLEGHDLRDVLTRFEQRTDPLGRYLHAELLVRNAWAFVPAFRSYEEAAAMAPDAPLFWETLGDRAAYAGAQKRAIPAYRQLGPEGREKAMEAHWQLGSLDSVEAEARSILEEDPHRIAALGTLRAALRQLGRHREADVIEERIETLERSPAREYRPLTLTFAPRRPVLRLDGPKRLEDGAQAYDYSDFSVTITNTSGRSVEVLSVDCERKGTAGVSPLGEISRWWRYDSPQQTLEPGASTTLIRTWGFEQDTDHGYVAHVFRYCWRGEGERRKQCGITRVDQLPL